MKYTLLLENRVVIVIITTIMGLKKVVPSLHRKSTTIIPGGGKYICLFCILIMNIIQVMTGIKRRYSGYLSTISSKVCTSL